MTVPKPYEATYSVNDWGDDMCDQYARKFKKVEITKRKPHLTEKVSFSC